jgi:hypothetical protein
MSLGEACEARGEPKKDIILDHGALRGVFGCIGCTGGRG